jgi:hypothetical protein
MSVVSKSPEQARAEADKKTREAAAAAAKRKAEDEKHLADLKRLLEDICVKIMANIS